MRASSSASSAAAASMGSWTAAQTQAIVMIMFVAAQSRAVTK
jgi:hypothetical protein